MNIPEEVTKRMKRATRARLIIAKLREQNLPQHLYEQIAGWLISDDNYEEKERQLSQLFRETFEHAPFPDKRAYEMYAEFLVKVGISGPNRTSARRIPLIRSVLYRVAAVLIPIIAIVGGTFHFLNNTSTPSEVITVAAAEGVLREIALPDGSSVRLKAGGTLQYAADFTKNRQVKLSGNAKFDVARNERFPFTVLADKLDVTVLGTVFSVESSPEAADAVVSLTSGSVEVGYGAGNTTVLDPLQRFVLDKSTGNSRVEPFDPAIEAKSYLRKLALDGVSLSEALVKIGELKGVDVSIAPGLDPSSTVRITLNEADSPENMLWMLQHLTGAFEYTIREDSITISSK